MKRYNLLLVSMLFDSLQKWIGLSLKTFKQVKLYLVSNQSAFIYLLKTSNNINSALTSFKLQIVQNCKNFPS